MAAYTTRVTRNDRGLDVAMKSSNAAKTRSGFVGYFDSLEGREASGWAFDYSAPSRPVTLHVLIDGQEVGTVLCDAEREDVRSYLDLKTTALGFRFTVPDRFIDRQIHRLSFRFPDRSIVPVYNPESPEKPGSEYGFQLFTRYDFQSFVDGFKRGVLRGWVHRIDPKTGVRSGGCDITIFMDDVRLCQARADRYRGDVAAATGGDPNCGFEVAIPAHRRKSGQLKFTFKVSPDEVELSGSPLVTSIIDNQTEASLLVMSETIGRLYKEISALRTQIADLMPKPGYTLDDYDRWARVYFDYLRSRIAGLRLEGKTAGYNPLVSVICPTYMPEISDFTAAVESVIAQTWTNWELIIVDDGCKSPVISQKISEYCKKDSRLKHIRLKKNVGISGATNAGLKAARGEWVAFFDHDDLLVDVALEAMLQSAVGTEATVLYSDEDKIDQAGYFLEPNLKPDFDYRFLLGCNYICHLLMVRTDILRQVGDLNSHYDGAQDHDLMLRLTEIVPRDQIRHVPEILYHWRKTPNSTAVTVANKGYAIDAGVRCVADHLKRIGKKADVSSIRGLTLYSVKWKLSHRPKVSIIIPFKDQAEITAECVERLLSLTKYKAFDIILVDNWSCEEETTEFLSKIRRKNKIKVLRVEEEFNFSRLNNLATQISDASLYFFMNNDLFVDDPLWLDMLVAEIQSEDDIAAVGGKFFYPNGTLQHVGVVVGPAGVAAHVHRGLPEGEYGYVGRAVLTYEVTAVTAAGMLVRADAFAAVGGFDEIHLAVAYNDVDLCLRLRTEGWRIIQCNEFTAVHHESLSRGSDDRPEHEARFFTETEYMQSRWGDNPLYAHDPAYSRYFTVDLQPYYDLIDPASI